MDNDTYVNLRLAHGSMCSICPLDGQRKVGKDGPVSASVYGIAEAPGEDEERWGLRRGQKYGTPLVGKSGYRMRIENLVPAGLAMLEQTGGRYPRIKLGDVFLTNVILCRPPNNDIDSKEGKAAVLCCQNSLKWFLRAQLAERPDRTLVTIGATSTSVIRSRKTKIDAHRGRVQHHPDVTTWAATALAPTPETEILKKVLRGRKPKEEWWPRFEKTLNAILVAQRRGVSSAATRLSPEVSAVIAICKLVLTKQRAALKKRQSALTKVPSPVLSNSR